MNRRNQRKAYFQQTDRESVDGKITSNNPEKLGYPGEIKYERAPMAVPVGEDSRPWEQRWFEGAAAKTKQVMGPKGSEFTLKQEWQRIPSDAKVANAKLSAKFTRTAKPAESYLTIFATDKKSGEKTSILKATLGSIWGDTLDETNATLSSTPKYAKVVMDKIRKEGFSTVAYLMTGNEGFVKQADYYEDELDAGDAGMEMGDDLAGALEGEAEQTAEEATVTVDLLATKHEELETAQTELVEQTAPEETAEVFVQLQDAEKAVDEAKDELEMAASRLRDKTIKSSLKIKLIRLADEAIEDAVVTLETSDGALGDAGDALGMGAEVPAEGAGDPEAMGEAAVEQADTAIEAEQALVGDGAGEVVGEEVVEAPMPDAGGEIEIDMDGAGLEGAASAGDFVKRFLNKRAEARKKVIATEGDTNSAEQGKYEVTPEGAPKDGKEEISRAHPDGGHPVSNLTAGGKPENDGEVFETVTEAQDKDLAVANKMPSGNLNGKSGGDPNATAAVEGKVVTAAAEGDGSADKATKDFWAKELYGQGDEASKEFGKDLYKDFTPAKAKAAMVAAVEENQAKVVRAYEIAETASSKGFCDRTAEAKQKFAKEILAFDDKSFLSFKSMIDSAPERKVLAAGDELVRTASAKMPKVGQEDALGADSTEEAFVSRLSNIGWK